MCIRDSFQDYINSAGGGYQLNGYGLILLAGPSGIFRLRGNAQFWQDYAIEVTEFGRELMGYDQSLIGLVFALGEASASTQVSDVVVADRYVYSDHASYAAGGAFEIPFQYSVFRYIESRFRIEVDADLSIPSNILVENGQHKVHYNIASYALPQKYELTLIHI